MKKPRFTKLVTIVAYNTNRTEQRIKYLILLVLSILSLADQQEKELTSRGDITTIPNLGKNSKRNIR